MQFNRDCVHSSGQCGGWQTVSNGRVGIDADVNWRQRERLLRNGTGWHVLSKGFNTIDVHNCAITSSQCDECSKNWRSAGTGDSDVAAEVVRKVCNADCRCAECSAQSRVGKAKRGRACRPAERSGGVNRPVSGALVRVVVQIGPH